MISKDNTEKKFKAAKQQKLNMPILSQCISKAALMSVVGLATRGSNQQIGGTGVLDVR